MNWDSFLSCFFPHLWHNLVFLGTNKSGWWLCFCLTRTFDSSEAHQSIQPVDRLFIKGRVTCKIWTFFIGASCFFGNLYIIKKRNFFALFFIEKLISPCLQCTSWSSCWGLDRVWPHYVIVVSSIVHPRMYYQKN